MTDQPGRELPASAPFGPYLPALADVQATQGQYIAKVQDLDARRAQIRAASLAADLTLRAYFRGLEIEAGA
jgi:hypothetical protein